MKKLVCFVCEEEALDRLMNLLDKDSYDSTLSIMDDCIVKDVDEETINRISHCDDADEVTDLVAEQCDAVIDAICTYHNHHDTGCDGSCDFLRMWYNRHFDKNTLTDAHDEYFDEAQDVGVDYSSMDAVEEDFQLYLRNK